VTRDDSARIGASDPSLLDRDGLLALVRDLESAIDRQRTIIDRQEGRIAELESSLPGRAVQPPKPARAMKPVAGADYTIVFDGGSINNPGRGYGSFQIVDQAGSIVAADKLDYGMGVSNNAAEYRSLIAALERLQDLAGTNARSSAVAIRGDSQLVIRQVKGEWKVNKVDLKPLNGRARELLAAFGSTDVQWHGRDKSVRILGH
jgi:ribonuclease HI